MPRSGMAIPTTLLDIAVPTQTHEVDDRWTMAYAASLGDSRPAYFDTTSVDGLVAHPLFAVCVEWPVIVSSRDASRDAGVSASDVITSVHATHDVEIHRLVRPGDRLTTTMETVALVQKSPGAMSTIRLETVDAAGAPVATTRQDGIYLGVPVDGDDRPDRDPPPPIAATDRRGEPAEVAIPIAAGAAHTYTECARIWNPIHTSKQVALDAGLPDIILHGTANLAHGVTAVVDAAAGGDPRQVRRISCRFAAMVRLPDILTVRIWPANPTPDGRRTVPFEVRNSAGETAVSDGLVVLGQPSG